MNVWVQTTTAPIMVTVSILWDPFYVLATMGILEMGLFVKVNIISCFDITVSQSSTEITPGNEGAKIDRLFISGWVYK